jgi:putative ATP-dependent endonuclease of OLD family
MGDTILIKTVRVNGFRGLKNIEVELEQTTVLTGMNNAGKTSFLKALQIVFGNRHFITQDDFFIENGTSVDKILIDILIIPIIDGVEVDNFSEYRRNFYAICVDEAQDLNNAQYKLLLALTNNEYRNIMMVGDPKQSIFHFSCLNAFRIILAIYEVAKCFANDEYRFYHFDHI